MESIVVIGHLSWPSFYTLANNEHIFSNVSAKMFSMDLIGLCEDSILGPLQSILASLNSGFILVG